MSDHILSRQPVIDNLIFTLRGWLNWAVIQHGIVKLHLRRQPGQPIAWARWWVIFHPGMKIQL